MSLFSPAQPLVPSSHLLADNLTTYQAPSRPSTPSRAGRDRGRADRGLLQKQVRRLARDFYDEKAAKEKWPETWETEWLQGTVDKFEDGPGLRKWVVLWDDDDFSRHTYEEIMQMESKEVHHMINEDSSNAVQCRKRPCGRDLRAATHTKKSRLEAEVQEY